MSISFNHFLLSARPLSAGRLLQQPRPPAARLLFGAQHQDHPWTLPLLLEPRSTPHPPSGHHQSRLAQAHPSTLSTATRIPSAHLHRSPPGQPASHPVFPGMTSSWCIYYVIFAVNNISPSFFIVFQESQAWFVISLSHQLSHLYIYINSQHSFSSHSSLLCSLCRVVLVSPLSLCEHVSPLVVYLLSPLQPKTPWRSYSPAHHYPPCWALPARLDPWPSPP